ncbi:gamma-glutamyltransferase [Phenylobacterium sp.]|uniref:gamma-glutamyltransferase n=1 Tax=Phenylobacterium sp. TaxID=1871053 RepID=UPI00286D8116|nr:gamma-glutamyltransferase [Phenylobacterium sp.]
MLGQPTTAPAAFSRRRMSPALGQGGMVAAAHPLVVAAALDVLKRGGNAVDAAVSGGLTASVVMPEMCGLGGDLFAIVHAPGQAPLAVLGSGVAPRSATLEQMRKHGDPSPTGVKMPFRGPLSVAVPGMVHAFGALLEQFGSRPLAELAEPAIAYAHGFPLTPLGAHFMATSADLLNQYPASAAVFLPGGEAPKAGSILRQPDLARTLRTIAAQGPQAFYAGDTADRIAAFMAANGGELSANDLAAHQTIMAPPIATTYRGHTVFQTGLPSQGMILLEALNLAEHRDSQTLARGDAAAIHLLAEAVKLAYADRLGFAVDPAFGDSRLETLISKPWAAKRFAQIDPHRAATKVPAGEMVDGDTTYFCVADGQGMMVSLIQSVSSNFGSGVVAGDTGVVLNNRAGRGFSLEDGHPNIFAPGKKTLHTLNCYAVADAAGVPVLVGGTPGGDGQPQWNLQTLVALIDGRLDVQAAIEAPRWTVWPGTDPSTLPNPYELQIESRVGDAVLTELEARGHTLRRFGAWGGGGAAQAIARDPVTGVLAGGSDPRAEGLALGF